MTRYRPLSLIFTIAFAIGALGQFAGCGSNPEEGTLHLPARKGEVAEIAKLETPKASPAPKSRRVAKEDPGGK